MTGIYLYHAYITYIISYVDRLCPINVSRWKVATEKQYYHFCLLHPQNLELLTSNDLTYNIMLAR